MLISNLIKEQHYSLANLEQNAIISTKQIPSSYDVKINSLSIVDNKLIAVFGLEDNIQYNNNTWYPNRNKKVYAAIKSIEDDNFPSIYLVDDFSSSLQVLTQSVGLKIGTKYYIVLVDGNNSLNYLFQIFPSIRSLGNFSNEYLQGKMTICQNKLIDSTGKIFDLTNESANKTSIFNFNETGGYMHPFYKKFGSSSSIAGFVHFDHKSWCVIDEKSHIFEGSSSYNKIAEFYEFDDEFILAGSKDDKFFVTRINADNLEYTSEHSLNKYFDGDIQTHNLVDMNVNKQMCVLYKDGLHYISCADLSGDTISPVIQFNEMTSNFTANETQTISWTFSDNNDETDKIELYEIIDNVETLVNTYDHTIFQSQYTFPDSENVTLKLLIFDKDNNIGSDELNFQKIIPFTFYSVTADKNEYNTEEKIDLQWEDNGNQSTQYKVFYKLTQEQDWMRP